MLYSTIPPQSHHPGHLYGQLLLSTLVPGCFSAIVLITCTFTTREAAQKPDRAPRCPCCQSLPALLLLES